MNVAEKITALEEMVERFGDVNGKDVTIYMANLADIDQQAPDAALCAGKILEVFALEFFDDSMDDDPLEPEPRYCKDCGAELTERGNCMDDCAGSRSRSY